MLNKSIYEKNMESLKKTYIDIYNGIEGYVEEGYAVLDKSVHDEDIIAVKKDNRLYYLNSRYNDDEHTDTWIEQYRNVNYQAVFIIFGLSNFVHVKKLLEISNNTNLILLYEPDKEIFKKGIQIADISEIIESGHVILCVKGLNDNYFIEFITFGLSYARMRLVNYCCMPNYDNLYLSEWRDLIKQIKARFEILIMDRNTLISNSDEFIINLLYNCEDMINQHSLNQLKDEYRKIDKIEEIPAILVSAGPSLDKNIGDLKQAVGKSVIVAVDTALKTLLHNGIKPDIIVTVDSHKPPILFMHSDFCKIPMIVDQTANKELWVIHSGKRFYFSPPNSYMSYLYEIVKGEKMQITNTGGSVANNAFSAIQVLGFKTIIMVGQDLAYPEKKMHTDAAYGGTEQDKVDDDKKYFEVEDIFGGKVLTEPNMDLYKKWFENQIIRYSYLKVIDATEGGAKIAGTEIMTLRDAIERECKIPINPRKIIDTIPPLFNEDEREFLQNKIASLPEELDEAEKKIQQGIRDYEKLEELYRKGKSGTKEFAKIMEKIQEVSKYVEEDPVIELSALYVQIAEYELLSQVYHIKDEVRDITSQGVKMLKSYIEGIKSLKKDLAKRKNVDREDVKNVIGNLKEQILHIEEFTKSDDYEKMHQCIKDYYKYAVELVNKLLLDKAEYEENYHERLLKDLDVIVKDYEDKKYPAMVEHMKGEFSNILNEITV